MSVDWDYDNWKAKINSDITKPFACNLNFKSYDKFVNTITYNEEVVNTYPEKGNLSVTVSCNNIEGSWDYDTWKPILTGAGKDTVCDIKFEDKKELLVTREILDQGEFKNVTPEYITDGVNGTDGFTVGGILYSAWTDIGEIFRWDYLMNFDDFDYIKFYAKKSDTASMIAVVISDGLEGFGWKDERLLMTCEVSGDLNWGESVCDVKNIKGVHTISFIGGRFDGGQYYATSYSNIRFTLS